MTELKRRNVAQDTSRCHGGSSGDEGWIYDERTSSSGDIFLTEFEEKAVVNQRPPAVEVKRVKDDEEYYPMCSKVGIGVSSQQPLSLPKSLLFHWYA